MKYISMIFAIAILLCGLSNAQTTTAPATQPTGPTVIRLTLHPMATSQPSLQYELLPPMEETKSGDAAYKYELADKRRASVDFDRSKNVQDQLLDADRTAFPIKTAIEFMQEVSTRWIHDGARCDNAHWDSDFRNNGTGTLLPYLSSLRDDANLVAVEGRLAIAQGDYKNAQQCIQTNLSMARQLNDNPFIVQGFVAAVIGRLALDKNVTDWIAREHSPNLFWSLVNLPRPYIDLPAIARMERAGLKFTDRPYLAEAIGGTLPADQWPQVIRFMVRLRLAIAPDSPNLEKIDAAAVEKEYQATLARETSSSKNDLASTEMSQAEVARLSDAEAVGRCWVKQYTLASDEQWKAWPLPYPQAVTILRATQAALDDSHQKEHNLLMKFFDFSTVRARLSFALLDRQIALLSIVEALRDYTARQGGELPDSLDQITDLPIPQDPITGKPFDYKKHGHLAVIDAPAPPDASPAVGRRYELTFAPS